MKKQQSNGMIDKGIPVPTGRHGHTQYPWHEMEVGDSFLLPQETSHTTNHTTYYNFRYRPKHFIQRRTPEGIRVWRDK